MFWGWVAWPEIPKKTDSVTSSQPTSSQALAQQQTQSPTGAEKPKGNDKKAAKASHPLPAPAPTPAILLSGPGVAHNSFGEVHIEGYEQGIKIEKGAHDNTFATVEILRKRTFEELGEKIARDAGDREKIEEDLIWGRQQFERVLAKLPPAKRKSLGINLAAWRTDLG